MSRKHFLLLWSASLGVLMSLSANSILYPLWMEANDFSISRIGLISGIGALGALFGRLSLGWAIDRFGTRPFLLLGVLLWLVTSPLTAWTENSMWLIVFRLLQGLGGAFFTAGALSFINYRTNEAERGAVVSWWDTAGSFANLLAPVSAAWLVQVASFNTAFAASGAAAGLALLVGFFLPQSYPRQEDDAPQATFKLFTPSAVLPGLYAAVLGYAAGAVLVLSPVIAGAVGLENAGLYLLAFSIGTLVVRPVTAPLSDRKGRSWVIIPGIFVMALSLLLLGLIRAPGLALLPPLVFGIGLSSALPGLMAWNGDRATASTQGIAASTLYALWETGIFAGSLLQGRLIDLFGLQSFTAVSLSLVLCGLVYIAVLRRKRVNHIKASLPG